MEDNLIFTPPVSIHVIGFGKETESIIRNVSEYGYDAVSAYMADSVQSIQPSDTSLLAILCVDSQDDIAMQVSKSFYDANVLTVIVTTRPIEFDHTDYDSKTVVSIDQMESVVKNLLDPLFLPGMISFNFNDLDYALRKSLDFCVRDVTVKRSGKLISAALKMLGESISAPMINAARNLCLILYYNPAETQLKVKEVMSLNDFIGKMPETTDVIWAVSRDCRLSANSIRLSAIVS